MAIERKHVNRTPYDDMAFPDYQYREFPTAVPVVDGVVQPTPYDENHKAHPVVMVNSQAELDALMGGDAELVSENYEKTVSRVKTEDDEREALYVEADQKGVKVDKRWSVEKIRKAIADHEEGAVL